MKTIFLFLLLLSSAMATHAQGRFFGGTDDGYASDSVMNQSLASVVRIAAPTAWQVTVSPNPTTDKVHLALPNGNGKECHVQVLDLQGREALSAFTFEGNDHTIELGTLTVGSYLLVISQGDRSATVKVIKE